VTARKRFGQNFLIDSGVIQNIINYISPQTEQHFVEIGPGRGALTYPLLEYPIVLDAIEIDRDLIQRWQKIQQPSFTLHTGDALRFDLKTINRNNKKLRIVGNLPYNISTPLLFHLLNQIESIQDLHFMLQKEVAERMAAQPHNRQYGRLSIMIQYACQVTLLFDVPPTAFKPIPQVTSSLVRLIPHSTLPYPAKDYELFKQLVTQAFNQRRKTLRNALKKWFDNDDWEQLNIDPISRPENITVQQYVQLANYKT